MAKKGLHVEVFEEHRGVGSPSHCAGHLSIKGLRGLGLYPLPNGIVENAFRGASFYSPSGRAFNIRFTDFITCAINRELFDKHLCGLAKAAGARFNMACRVKGLTIESGFVRGVVLDKAGNSERVQSDVVVDAEGVSSRLVEQSGLQTLNRDMVVMGVEVEVDNCTGVTDDEVEVFFGSEYTPRFYGWLIPRRDGSAKIGLACKRGNPFDYLKRLIRRHPVISKQVSHSKILGKSIHPIPLGGSIPSICRDGFVVVGDAASQVKPTTGGGVILGLNSALIASGVIKEAFEKHDFSIKQLCEYQTRCNRFIGFDMRLMRRIRNSLDRLSDKQLDDLLRFFKRFQVDRALRDMSDLDFQGRGLLSTFGDPRMLAAVGYFVFLSLPANA